MKLMALLCLNTRQHTYCSRGQIVDDELSHRRRVEMKCARCEQKNGQRVRIGSRHETCAENIRNATSEGFQEVPKIGGSTHVLL